MDAKGDIAAAFDTEPLRFQPREVEPGLSAMAMYTEDALREYLRLFAKVPTLLTKIGPLARTFDFVADAAPGVREILSVGKLCYEVRERHYDVVVVDAHASGHVLSEIDAPRAMQQFVKVGMIREQTMWMSRLLEDPATTGVVVVTTPEEMPVTETLELVERLRATTKVSLAAIVANRVLPEPFGHGEEAIFAAIEDRGGRELLVGEIGPAVGTVLDAASLAVRLRRRGASHLARLREGLGALGATPDAQIVYVPELFARSAGRRSIELVAAALAEER